MTTRSSAVDVIVIGAGQAGISLSYYLQQEGVSHVVLERDRAFSSWHCRWDGFHANTPAWMNTLPILPQVMPGGDRDEFVSREELIDYFARCLDLVDPPIRAGTEVTRVTQVDHSLWHVETADHLYESRAVAICTGALSTQKIPAIIETIPPGVTQIYSMDYRRPDQISTDNVLVVGSGSSGVQICQLLGESRRLKSLHLAVSNVMALPRHVLGIPAHRFFHIFRMFDWRVDTLRGKMMSSNLGSTGFPITRPRPKDLQKNLGVELHGRLVGANERELLFDDDSSLSCDDLSIVWCTGLRADYGFIELQSPNEVFDSDGRPIHVRGVAPAAPGLYFVGLLFQYTVASHDIYGVARDARHVAEHMSGRLASAARA